jgi:hypothetical protein
VSRRWTMGRAARAGWQMLMYEPLSQPDTTVDQAFYGGKELSLFELYLFLSAGGVPNF